MNWIKCESKKARLLKGQDGVGWGWRQGGGEGVDGRYANVFTVSTLKRIKHAFKKKLDHEIRDI